MVSLSLCQCNAQHIPSVNRTVLILFPPLLNRSLPLSPVRMTGDALEGTGGLTYTYQVCSKSHFPFT